MKIVSVWMYSVLAGILMFGTHPASAFNLITDVEQNTLFTVGQTAAAGTAVNLRNGQYSASELAQISQYRMLSLWYGGTEVGRGDNTFTMTDSLKIGLNLSYFLSKFTNPLPPSAQWLNNIVVGPSFAMSVFSTPRVGTPFVDINYAFGSATTPVPVKTTPATPGPAAQAAPVTTP